MPPAVETAPPLPVARERPTVRLERLYERTSRETRWLWLAVFVFVAVSFWWLTQDNRIPDFDSGLHMSIANGDRSLLAHGHLLAPFTGYNTYPPLVHLVGALTIFISGVHPMALIFASNLVFVPLLAFGCYGVGKFVAGPRAGLLAGLFGLGTPMFVSMMHNFDLDTPEAAMVAVSVWAVLASRRFERPGQSALAGVLCGLALLTKETAAVFLVGLVLTTLARGGWRNWRGLILFLFALENVAGPWYVYHFSQLTQTFTQIGQLWVNSVQSPPRSSLRSVGWYFWNLVNEQILLPFTIAFFIGVGVALKRCARGRRRISPENVLPELLIGGFVSYIAMTYLTHKDPRYTLPALVYVAVLSTFWVVTIPRKRPQLVTTASIIGVAIINFAGMAFGIGGSQRIMLALPGAHTSMIFPWQLTAYEDWGWTRGGPEHDGDVLGLMKGLRKTGITRVGLDPDVNQIDFSADGLPPVANAADMNVDQAPRPSARLAYLLLHSPRPGDPPPCQRLNDGSGIYAVAGPFAGLNSQLLRNPADPPQQFRFICPGRPTIVWPPRPAS